MNRPGLLHFVLSSSLFKVGRTSIIVARPLFATSTFLRSTNTGTPRAFNTTSLVLAKKQKKEKEVAASDGGSVATETLDLDAQFDKLESEIARIADKLKDDLAKLRAGRADPTILEGLNVLVDKAEGASVSLRDLAHVVTKGRGLAVTVYEVVNVKRIVSAIQIADLNLQPVVDTKNPQLINVPLPPPTRELRDGLVKQAEKVGHKALDAVKNARLATHKKIQGARKAMRPDDIKKADKKMEDIVKKRRIEVEAVIAASKYSIMEG